MSIPDYYLVKWLPLGANCYQYGVCNKYSPEAQAHYEKTGEVLIEDAIFPVARSVPVAALIPIESSFSGSNEFYDMIHSEMERVQALSDALPAGIVKGKLFRVPCGDGYAWYIVMRVNKKTVKIEWRGFSSDRWVDQRFGLGGNVPIEMVEQFIRYEDGTRQLFSKKKEETDKNSQLTTAQTEM